MVNNTTPYLIFEKIIADYLIDNDVYDQEWFESEQTKQRMSMYWNHGETPEIASETLFFFAQGNKLKSVNPTDSRICIGVDYF